MIEVQVYQPVVPEYRVPLFNALSEQHGLRLTVHASPNFPGSPPKGISRFRFSYVERPSRRLWGRALLWQAGQFLPRNMSRGDVVVVCGNPRVLSTYRLLFQAIRRGVGLVWWSQWRGSGPERLSLRIRRHLMRLADVLLLYTDKEAEEAVRYGFSVDRVFATNNAVDTSEIGVLRESWHKDRLESFLATQGLHGQKLLLFCGRLAPRCELPLAFQALALLRDRGLRPHLAVIGDGPARSDFVSAAERLKVQGVVHWCGAIYEGERLALWFLGASAFVFPGTIGLSLLHALAYGLPVVTHGDPAFHGPEFAALQDGWNGLVFRRGEPGDLAAKLQQVLRDDVLRREMQTNALATVKDQYSMEAMTRRFVQAVTCASAISRNRR